MLTNAITSVLTRTFDDFGLIISDDCSTDATPEIVKSFGDSRVCYIRHSFRYSGLLEGWQRVLDRVWWL